MTDPMTPAAIREARAENRKARARDFAEMLGLSEGQLVAAHVGRGVTRIDARPGGLIGGAAALGDVLALTRNAHCVHERVGTYDPFHDGDHAAMVTGPEIDLRIFPAHWVHAYAVVEPGEDGPKRSLQIFDAAGDAVHKLHMRAESNVAAFDALVERLRLPDQSEGQIFGPRRGPEPARADAARVEDLRAGWDRMTDTHQFISLVHRLKMNRLGAYRLVGAPRAEPLPKDTVTRVLETCAAEAIPVMIFVGNRGCIQIHGGPIHKVAPMGPWINVLDPRFDMHLRTDKVAEVWCVAKPTRRGPAISVEAFDAAGDLILQIFGYRKDASPDAWDEMAAALPRLSAEAVA